MAVPFGDGSTPYCVGYRVMPNWWTCARSGAICARYVRLAVPDSRPVDLAIRKHSSFHMDRDGASAARPTYAYDFGYQLRGLPVDTLVPGASLVPYGPSEGDVQVSAGPRQDLIDPPLCYPILLMPSGKVIDTQGGLVGRVIPLARNSG
ncbi:hypothetical protein R1flu_024273 [Riccia fluitans]|uniref:Uncharacterized protein n=1 Tax=Riccia fluitans TaxID=41844 RepID=A0ABD1XXG1_9MARC